MRSATLSYVDPPPISLVIVACDEEDRIGRCLASAADLASEIVVVDSGSTDRTREIAAEWGARVIHQDWLGYREQKNFAIRACGQPWILALDADEALSPKLHESIVNFFTSQSDQVFSGARFNRCTWFLGRWIRHGDWYPDVKLRLAVREKAHWGGSAEHDRLEVEGETVHLKGDLQHFSFADMAAYVAKINRFADSHFERCAEDPGKFSPLGIIFRSFWRFFRAYFIRRGFLDGFPGFWIAAATGFHTFARHTRLFEREVDRTIPPESIYQTKALPKARTRDSS